MTTKTDNWESLIDDAFAIDESDPFFSQVDIVDLEGRPRLLKKGGEGSGNFGHAGRPGLVGGSASEGGSRQEAISSVKQGTIHSQQKYQVNGKYTDERRKVHQGWIDDVLKDGVKRDEGIVYFLGGGPASGKSSAIINRLKADGTIDKTVPIIDPDHFKHLSDDFKRLSAAGDETAGGYVHEESSDISKAALAQGLERGFNMVYDTSGDNSYEKLERKVKQLRQQGAKVLNARYVFVSDINEAVLRANARAAEQRAKTGFGRDLPESVLRAYHTNVASVFREAIKNKLFDTAELWSTDGPKPQLAITYDQKSGLKIVDQALWDRFNKVK